MMKKTWTKADAASQQLDAAIGEFSERRYIAAHTLTSAASELAVAVARSRGRNSHVASFEALVQRAAPERLAEVRAALRRPQNFAKHADRDPTATIEVDPRLTEITLFQAILDVGIAFEVRTFRQVIYAAWFAARNPDALLGENAEYMAGVHTLFGDLRDTDLDHTVGSLSEAVMDLDQDDLRQRFTKATANIPIDWQSSLGTSR